MDETRLIARAQLRMLGQAAGLSRETVERQFESIFDESPERRKPAVERKRRAAPRHNPPDSNGEP